MAGDGEHRLPVELRVVEPVQKVKAAGARGREADAEPAGELRIAARHERGRLLMPDLDEAHLILPDAQRLHDAVDAVAGKAEHDLHAPVTQRFDQDIRRRLRHATSTAPVLYAHAIGIGCASGDPREGRRYKAYTLTSGDLTRGSTTLPLPLATRETSARVFPCGMTLACVRRRPAVTTSRDPGDAARSPGARHRPERARGE